MSSRSVLGGWRRVAVTLLAIWMLHAADGAITRAVAAPVSLAALAVHAAIVPANGPYALVNWGGCWRCGGFVGSRHPFFFQRPFFRRDRLFFARRAFVRPFFFRGFDDRLGFP